MFIIIFLSAIACVIFSFFYQNFHLFSFRTVKSLPGPIRLPFIGSSYCFLQRGPEDFLNTIIQLCDNYSSPFQVWVGSKKFVTIYEPDQIETILRSRFCLDKSILYKIVESYFGTGLLTASTSIWSQNRKIIAPTFNASILRKFFDVFVRESLIFTKELEKIVQNANEINFLEHLERFTLRISCDTMMGVKMEKNKINKFVEEIESAKEILRYRFRNPFMMSDIIFNLSSLGRKQRKLITFRNSFIDEMIQQSINKSRTANDDTVRKTFFDIFMSSPYNNRLTHQEILDNTITMILASSDTIAVTMHFVIFMVANFPEIQEKVYKELSEIYTDTEIDKFDVKYDDLEHMHYLDCVIKETLRLFPTVPLIGRQLAKNLEMGDLILSKGTDIIISFIHLNRSEKYWANPLNFDPDRFLDEPRNYQFNCYMPFSTGPRNCIGIKYAVISMKAILSTLIWHFKFTVRRHIKIEEIKLNVDIVLCTTQPLKIQFKKRNNVV